jgi:hypothetical protein
MHPRSPKARQDPLPAAGTRPIQGGEQGRATEEHEPRREIVFLSKSHPCAAWDQLKILIQEDEEDPEAASSWR